MKDENDKSVFRYPKQFKKINGLTMAYVETGSGDPIIFLHGNPTSSYIWRNIIPYAEPLGRCIAPDLIGMGDSEKLPSGQAYTFASNQQFLEGLLDALGVKAKITFVVHDWGSVLALDWARRHPDAVKGIVYMESLIRPRTWEEVPPAAQQIFRSLRSDKGEEMILQQNSFIELNLPRTVQRKLSEIEMENYRKPYLVPGEGRQPMLSWARQLPIGGEPANIVKIVDAYDEWLSQSRIPKLFIEANPGTLSEKEKVFCNSLRSQTHIVLRGSHNLQEDVPDEIGISISVWLQGITRDSSSR